MSFVPYVIEESPRGERGMDIWSRLMRDRIIMLNTDVNSHSANIIVSQLLLLASEDPSKDISLFINSPGGFYKLKYFLINSLSSAIISVGSIFKSFRIKYSITS